MIAAGCAKERTVSSNEATKRYFDAWIDVQKKAHPEYMWEKVGDGIYILEDAEGDGDVITDSSYVLVNYTCTDLEGNIIETNSEELSHKADLNYDESYYYGPATWINSDVSLTVGVRDIIIGMKKGGTRKAVIPSWLSSTTRYGSEEEYLANVNDGSNYIYEINIADATTDIFKYQTDSMDRYWKRNVMHTDPDSPEGSEQSPYPGPDGILFKEKWDTAYTGFLFRQYFNNLETDENGSPSMRFKKDSTLYINYTGRLLNGQVFDTTIADTAKVHNIYSPTKSYEPVEIKWSSDSTAITFGGSDEIINGFKSMLKHLCNEEPGKEESFTDGERAVAIFYSSLGYGYSGSGSVIPGFSPLRFDVTVVKQEEE